MKVSRSLILGQETPSGVRPENFDVRLSRCMFRYGFAFLEDLVVLSWILKEREAVARVAEKVGCKHYFLKSTGATQHQSSVLLRLDKFSDDYNGLCAAAADLYCTARGSQGHPVVHMKPSNLPGNYNDFCDCMEVVEPFTYHLLNAIADAPGHQPALRVAKC